MGSRFRGGEVVPMDIQQLIARRIMGWRMYEIVMIEDEHIGSVGYSTEDGTIAHYCTLDWNPMKNIEQAVEVMYTFIQRYPKFHTDKSGAISYDFSYLGEDTVDVGVAICNSWDEEATRLAWVGFVDFCSAICVASLQAWGTEGYEVYSALACSVEGGTITKDQYDNLLEAIWDVEREYEPSEEEWNLLAK